MFENSHGIRNIMGVDEGLTRRRYDRISIFLWKKKLSLIKKISGYTLTKLTIFSIFGRTACLKSGFVLFFSSKFI